MTPINGAFILHEDLKLLSFCSYDHLALADSPVIKKNGIKYVLQHGICPFSEAGDFYLTCQQDLEKKLSDLLRREASLFFPSREEANRTTLAAISHEDARIFVDEKCHPSLIPPGALRYHPDQLEGLIEKARTSQKIIVTESIFSSDGSISNLPMICELADHYDALLYVDDSHAFGIAGVDGMGLCAHLREVDIISGSFSHTCGAYGGYVACNQTIRNYLLNHLLSNALLSPLLIGAIEAALELIPQMEGERKQLEQRSHWLRAALREMGFSLPKYNTPLISFELKKADRLKAHLLKEQIVVMGENNQIRIALNISHMPDHLTHLTDTIKSFQMACACL
ncbi:MAG: aminotransferase class I/II-fold pyridoxal phosphate-dependent enzyme [Verrucomicrobia bacterium]|nr:aminotransferase class I/II-fold pyridoxal phosphate-dependent enzyme [Verrucomicrobiota bacterium]